MTGQVHSGGLAMIPVGLIHPNPDNPRKQLQGIPELAASIKAQGLIQPLVVQLRTTGAGYELISGHRRHAALVSIRAAKAPCLIAPSRKDGVVLALMLVENGQRVNLNPMEEARAFQRLIDEHHLSQSEIARAIGKSQTHVSHRLALLHLSDDDQQAVERKEIRTVDAITQARINRGTIEDTKFTGWHLGKAHPLADTVRALCSATDHPRNRYVSGIGCGACWEQAIRDDQHATTVELMTEADGHRDQQGGAA